MITDYLAKGLPAFDWPNFNYLLRDVCPRFEERVAFRYRARGEDGFETWSYGRLWREASGLGSYLLSKGLAAGDRVAIWSENRPAWGAAYMGIVAAGLVAAPIDVLLPEAEATRILRSAEVGAVVASGRFATALGGIAKSAPSVRAVVDMDGASWSEAIAYAERGPGLPSPESIAPEAEASIIFSSGTTGEPKGIVLSHSGIIANFDASIRSLPITKDDVFMCVLPLHHSYPTTCSLVSPLAVGASITIVERVVGKVIVDDVRDTGGSVMIAVPLLYDKLAQAMAQGVRAKGPLVAAAVGAMRAISRAGCALGLPGLGRALFKGFRAKAGLGSLRLLVAGGGPLNPSTARAFDEFGFTIVQGYGMSENGPLISTNTPRWRDHRSAGLVVSRTKVRIADAGEEGIGEIQVTSPSLMKGYWRDPEATAAAFTPDGWLRTGDLGRIDSRGFIFITGRIKSLIVTAGGKNICPEEIEARFELSRVAREVLVLGKPEDADGGAGETVSAEQVAAVIVPDLEAIAEYYGAERARDKAAVLELVRAEIERINRSLPPYKKIGEYRVREEEFEKTSSRKIKRYLYRTWEAAVGGRP